MDAEEFKHIRRQKRLTLRQMGKLVDRHPRTVRRYEKGTKPVPECVVEKAEEVRELERDILIGMLELIDSETREEE